MTGVKMSGVDATTGTPWELVGPQVAAVMGITDSGEWLTAAAGFPMQSPSTIEATVIVESLFAVPSPGNEYVIQIPQFIPDSGSICDILLPGAGTFAIVHIGGGTGPADGGKK